MARLRTHRRRMVRAALITTIALVITASIAYAAFPTGGGNLRACVNNSTGLLRVLNTGQTCTAKETAIGIASTDPTGRVQDAQKLDGKDSSAFVHNGSAAGGSLTGTYPNPAIRSNSIGAGHISDATFSDGDIVPVFGTRKSFHIPNGAIQGAEIATSTINGSDILDNSLTGSDIDDATLSALDGHDAFNKTCSPIPDSFLFRECASVTFTTGRAMPIFMTVVYSTYGVGLGGGYGECKTRLDGLDLGLIGNSTAHQSAYPQAGVPIVDVISAAKGTHTLQFMCNNRTASSTSSIVYSDIRMAVLELGMD